MKKILILSLMLGLCRSHANSETFSDFDKVLKSHLKINNLEKDGLESSFNYKQAKKNQISIEHMKRQATQLKIFDINSLKNKEEALAFWINCYNFFMIKIILEKGFKNNKLSIESVKDLGSFFNPYKIFKQKINNIGGSNYSLDQIEKEILLGTNYKQKNWKDARIHFAVNCASVGCPPLIKDVYQAKTINQVLDENIKKALKTSRHMKIEDQTLHLTHLFKWYKSDFIEHSGSIKKFIKKYIDQETAKKVEVTKKIKYIDYNWNLNKPENF